MGQEFASKKSFHCAKQQNNVALSGWDVWHCRRWLPAEISTRSIPVLVRGLENSCCRSLFSVVLKTTTMSAGRVSLFFSRNPSTLYMTCGVGKNTAKSALSALLNRVTCTHPETRFLPFLRNAGSQSKAPCVSVSRNICSANCPQIYLETNLIRRNTFRWFSSTCKMIIQRSEATCQKAETSDLR